MIQKTKILTLIVFGLLFINLSAQEDNFNNDSNAKLPDEDRKLRFGLQFSPNISWFKANTIGYESNGTKIGFSYGLSVEYFISQNYLFSSGIFLQNSGGKLSYKGAIVGLSNLIYSGDVDVSYNLKYIEIPLVLKLKTNEIGYLAYFGKFGLKTGFNYRSKGTFYYTYQEPRKDFKSSYSESFNDVSKDVNGINMSLVFGVGVEYNISGNTSMMFGLTFNNGFINQLDSKTYVLDDSGNVLFDNTGNPIYSEKDASANLNYIALNLGVYF